MKRRLFCLLLAAALLALPAAALAEYDYESVTTPNMIVIDAGDMTAASPIYERAADVQIYPASTTKILTCILALENGSLDSMITVGPEIEGHFELGENHAYTQNSSLMGLVEGESISLRDLLYGLMLVSGNEAADAIAVHIGGTIENFMAMMNQKAAELGMTNTHFVTPNGVHDEKHVSTARDMAKLAAYAMQNQAFRAIVATESYTVAANNVRQNELVLYNSNLLLTPGTSTLTAYQYDAAIGIKTGQTTRAGACLVAAAEKDGACAIVCIYGDPDTTPEKYQRFTTARGIFEDLFTNVYTTVTGAELNLQSTFNCPVEKGRADDLNANGELEVTADPSNLTIRALPAALANIKSNAGSIAVDVVWDENLSAPIRQGQHLGTVTYRLGEQAIFSLELTAPHDVLEVAVISASTDDGSGPAATGSLLTAPSAPATAEKKGGSLFLYIVIGLIVLLALVVLFSFLAAAQKKKRRRQRQAEKRRQQQLRRDQGGAPADGGRRDAAGRSGASGQRAGGSTAQRGASSAQRGSGTVQRPGTDAGRRSASPGQRTGASGAQRSPSRPRSRDDGDRR